MFHGAKAALFMGERLAVLRRDDKAGLPWRNCLDFPGGGREGAETPEETLIREVGEELGLNLPQSALTWGRPFYSAGDAEAVVWFFVAHLPAEAEMDVVFGNEGQGWQLMREEDYLAVRDTIPHLQWRLRFWRGLVN